MIVVDKYDYGRMTGVHHWQWQKMCDDWGDDCLMIIIIYMIIIIIIMMMLMTKSMGIIINFFMFL